MSLAAGTRFGPYEILSPLGRGGMGEVYKARDTKLGRDVAIKVLPEVFSGDPDRLARFEREATLLAALNHQNIAHVYGVEELGASRALVMEFVAGRTLHEVVRQPGTSGRALDLDEALAIGRQIADALEVAHERGIIHRDLKPANIMLTDAGTVKVLDFGLAKALNPEGASASAEDSPTLTARATALGMILGTAAYMAPEQAKGRAVDRRADIWAFGCVLFELLTGRRAFEGEDVSETLAFVITKEPDWAAFPPDTPPTLKRLVRRCLEKDRKRRLRDIGDVRLELDDALAPPTGETAASALSRPALVRDTRVRWAAVVVAASAITGLAVWVAMRPASPPPPAVQRLTLTTPAAARYAGGEPALSPDGTLLVYSVLEPGGRRLYLRHLDRLDAEPLRGTEGAVRPFFSPNGEWVAFAANNKLKKVSVRGGLPVEICDAPGPTGNGAWNPDDSIVFSLGRARPGLFRVSAAGGAVEPLTLPEAIRGEAGYAWPSFVPGAPAILVTVVPKGQVSFDEAYTVVFSPGAGTYRKVIERGFHARYVSSGHLIYALGASVLAVPFDPVRLETTGAPVPVVEGVADEPAGSASLFGDSSFAVSDAGHLVYAPASVTASQRTLVWVDRAGREESLGTPPRAYLYPRVSPDGARVAVDVREQGGHVWTWDTTRRTLTRLSLGGNSRLPAWTPDSRRILFASTRAGSSFNLFWQAADGTGDAERLTESPNTQFPLRVSRDGKWVVFQETDAGNVNMHVLALDGDRRSARPLLNAPYSERNAQVSPDGAWIVYGSDESGRYEIYVRPFPNVDAGRHQISAAGGDGPLWAPSGREIFYQLGAGETTEVFAVPVQTTPTFSSGTARRLFQGPYFSFLNLNYDVSPDGRRFLMVKALTPAPGVASASVDLIVVLNWTEELKRMVPPNR